MGEKLSVALTNFIQISESSAGFFRWEISVICPIILLKLAVTVFTSLYFWALWPNWLNIFRSFQRNSVHVLRKVPARVLYVIDSVLAVKANPEISSWCGNAVYGTVLSCDHAGTLFTSL